MCMMLSGLLLMVAWSALAQEGRTAVGHQASFAANDLAIVPFKEYHAIGMVGCDRLGGPAGSPDLPAQYVNILLPSGAKNARIVIRADETALPGPVSAYPVQPGVRPGDTAPPFAGPDAKIYGSKKPYPAASAELLGIETMRGYTYAKVALHPVRYVGATRTLLFASTIEVEVFCTVPASGHAVTGRNLDYFEKQIRQTVVNPGAEAKFRPFVKDRPERNAASQKERQRIIDESAALEEPATAPTAVETPTPEEGATPEDGQPGQPTAGETFSLSSATYSVNEGDGSVTITVNSSPRAAANTTVPYSMANGTATSPADFNGASGNMTVAKNQTSGTFTIPIVSDSAYEGDETFTVSISAPVGCVLGSPASAVVTIVDDDLPSEGTLSLSAATYEIAENGGVLTVTVNRVNGNVGAASVNYATSNGTATAGTHYTAASGTLNWADGEQGAKTFNVNILDNGEYAGDKTFNVTLSNASGASMGSPASAVVTIIEDEANPDACDYLIITTDALKTAFQPLADHRASFNKLAVKIVTVEHITANYDGTKPNGGSDTQTKIRNCIIDYVNNYGTLYVVLGGDNTIVPDRDCAVSAWGYNSTNHPTDFYYAGLGGNWDDYDADGVYGEADVGGVTSQDEGDLAADVIVGRIPVRTAEHIDAYVDKLIAYEANPPSSLLRKYMLTGLKLWTTYYAVDPNYSNQDSRPSDTNNDGHLQYRDANHPSVSDAEMWTRRKFRDKVQNYGWTASQIGMMFDTITSWDTTTAGDYTGGGANLVQR